MSAVDVVIPCYNYAHYLESCVETVVSQRDVEVRVLIIDDCSPDNTPEIGARLSAQDARVTYVRNETNLRLIGTSNRGVMDWASAPYTLLLSADDALVPGALARAVEVLDANENVGFAYGRARVVGEQAPPPLAPAPDEPRCSIISGPEFIRYSCVVGNPVPSPCAIVRTSWQKRLGGYRADLPHTSDMEMWMRFAAQGPVAAIDAVQADYRWHGQNMTTLYTAGPLKDLRERKRTCELAFAEYGAERVPEFGEYLREMRETMARFAFWVAGDAYAAGDMEGYRACLAFVAECDPNAKVNSIHWRHHLKRLLGPTVSGWALALASGRTKPLSKNPNQLEMHTEFGWCP